MRIIGGEARGKRLHSIDGHDPQLRLRPTSDRVREALFNILQNGRDGDICRGARVLDLFAGTGALGLEALSRGALFALFVEMDKSVQQVIRKNLSHVADEARGRIHSSDATSLGPSPYEPFDLVFLDPPYGKKLGEAALRGARAGGWLKEEAFIIWEEDGEKEAPSGFHVFDRRRFGQSYLTFLRYDG